MIREYGYWSGHARILKQSTRLKADSDGLGVYQTYSMSDVHGTYSTLVKICFLNLVNSRSPLLLFCHARLTKLWIPCSLRYNMRRKQIPFSRLASLCLGLSSTGRLFTRYFIKLYVFNFIFHNKLVVYQYMAVVDFNLALEFKNSSIGLSGF